MRNRTATTSERHALVAWPSLALFATVSAAAAPACTDFPSTLCVSCDKSCLDGLTCDAVRHVCVPPDAPGACDEPHDTGGAGEAGAAGQGGGPGEPSGNTVDGVAATNATTSSGAAANTNCDDASQDCEATIFSSVDLQADCSTPLAIQLEAGCACGPSNYRVQWKMYPELEGIDLSLDGKLTGEPEPGIYEFEAMASLNEGLNDKRDFTLTVSGACRIVFVSDPDGTGAELHAARLDGKDSEAEPLPDSMHTPATLSNFDLSPDGALLARVVESNGLLHLELMRMRRSEIQVEPLAYSGDYVAHAFSPDSRYLALVTREPTDEAEQLQLVELATDAVVVDSTSIAFESHLTWAAADWLVFYGSSSFSLDSFAPHLTAHEVFVTDGQVIRERERPDVVYPIDADLHGFFLGADGYLTLHRTSPVYAGHDEDTVFHHTPAEAVSPDVMWMTHDYATGSRVDRLVEEYDSDQPFGTASQCDLVLAWSEDGSKFLCSASERLFVYSTSQARGALDVMELEVPGGFDPPALRTAFSSSGEWLALVPNDTGMLLAKTSALGGSDAAQAFPFPVLESPARSDEWDFFFTSREDQLVVQWGSALTVIPLENAGEPERWTVSDLELPQVPICARGWFPSPDAWCGAPRFAGNFVVSHDERQFAFADTEGNVQVVDLATRSVFTRGSLSASCVSSSSPADSPLESRCIQFQ